MKQERLPDVVIRFSLPVKISVLLAATASLTVHLPLAVRSIPEEALAPMIFFLVVPACFVYASFFVLTYRVRITSDRIAAEAVPNPFLGSFECPYAGMTGIEKDTEWSSLLIYQFMRTDPFRLSALELLEGTPVDLLDAVKARVPKDVFLEWIPDYLHRRWKYHRLLVQLLVFLAAVWLSLQLLGIAGWFPVAQTDRTWISVVLLSAGFFLGAADWILYRSIHRGS